MPTTTVYDVTTFAGTVSPYTDIGMVINQIISDIKANQTTQTTRPGGVIYIPPGHYDLLTRVVIDISYLQIKGSGHGFISEGIRDGSNTDGWFETLPGASHIRVKNTDGHAEAFLVQRVNDPYRLNSVEFRDFCLDGTAFSSAYMNGKVGISVQSDNDSFRIEGMGFVYLEHALVVHGADALNITNNFLTECGSCIELTGSGQASKVTNNHIGAGWIGFSIFAEGHEGLLVSGNNIFPIGPSMVHFKGTNRSSISGNKFKSYYPGMVVFEGSNDENLISGNHFRREYFSGIGNIGRDDLYGLVHLSGSNNSVSSNILSYNVPPADITPSNADPTMILVAGGDHNYLAANSISSNVTAKVVLDGTSTSTKILYSAEVGQFVSYASASNYSFVATP